MLLVSIDDVTRGKQAAKGRARRSIAGKHSRLGVNWAGSAAFANAVGRQPKHELREGKFPRNFRVRHY